MLDAVTPQVASRIGPRSVVDFIILDLVVVRLGGLLEARLVGRSVMETSMMTIVTSVKNPVTRYQQNDR